ncbi:MAG: D-inositol-3-phosphate glycosyltransferase [Gammaproteobacteria bacterium]|nr:D-inositol-3-phosphate glycosyltransferase [Gammaproteobacteria bacterium]
MKILHAAWRYDPRDIDQASGVDFQVYQILLKNGCDVKIIDPLFSAPFLLERAVRMALRVVKKKYIKYDWSLAWKASQKLNISAKVENADVVFTLFPPSLVFYSEKTPVVYGVDTTFRGRQKEIGDLDAWAFNISVIQERMSLKKCSRIITYSDWSKEDLVNFYGVPENKIDVIVMPSSLPDSVIPSHIDIKKEKKLVLPLRLLLVGRDFIGKGVGIAMETVALLNLYGIPAELVVCGTNGLPSPYTRFVGPYKKGDAKELVEYAAWYRWAHLLLHPSLFEGAGIVPSEAAAFGVPTITNAVSALPTTVKDGVSGIVLPKKSPAEAYFYAIKSLVENPERYYALCASSRKRYEQELNWDAAGQKFLDVFARAASQESVPTG